MTHHPVIARMIERLGPGAIPTAVEEEYFEWIDLLLALENAEPTGCFVMAEVGAGQGRWGLFAASLAQKLGFNDVAIRFVEGEPRRIEEIERNLVGGADWFDAKVIPAVLSYANKPVPFAIEMPGTD